MPRVSVIIPAYNCAEFVGQAIQSALDQTYKDLEVIVVDDGSTDETARVVQAFGPKVIYLHQENRGLPATRNRAIQQSQGEYLALLDGDDWWEPTKLAEQVERLDADPTLGLIYTDLRVFYSDGDELASFLASRPMAQEGNVFDALLRNSFILPSTVLMRRECLATSGMFDETLRSHEDIDLWIRICKFWNVGLIRKPLTNRRQGPNNMTSDSRLRVEWGLRVAQKVFSRPDLTRKQREVMRGQVARAYFECGYYYSSVGRTADCRASLRSSMKLQLWSLATWRCYLLSFVPSSLLSRARKMRNAEAL